MNDPTKPLEGLLVLDFSLFLAGPLCALRLADLGARVIKIERPNGGDLCRKLYISDQQLDGDSTLFHAINRNKESFTADLKNDDDKEAVRKLIVRADVMLTNFRPGVMKRLGFDYESVAKINPGLVYGSISGYGDEGPWKDRPGQDLLAQALSGLMWLTGDGAVPDPDGKTLDEKPVPMGLAVADMFAGHFLAQGVLALLVKRGMSGRGGLVETSLLEALLDFQFEVLTTHLNDGGRRPQRSGIGNGHAYLAAPYGVYPTADGWLAIAMNPLGKLAELLNLPELAGFPAEEAFTRRDEIKRLIADHLKKKSNDHWLGILEPADVWCAPVLDWPQLTAHEAFEALSWPMQVTRPSGATFNACRSPLRVNRQTQDASRHAPRLGEHTDAIAEEFDLR